MQFFSMIIITLCIASIVYADNIFSIETKKLNGIESSFGKNAKFKILELVELLNELDKESEEKKLIAVNDFFNHLEFNDDIKIWNKKDYWASRSEFLGVSFGDCEDYVIAKYFSLMQLGFDDTKLFLTYVKAVKYKQSHMVLTYFQTSDSEPLILDNLEKKILPASQRRDLRPLFNFNPKKIYMAKQRGLGKEIPMGKVNLTKWSDMVLMIQRVKR